jgi:hypothetical protein
MSETFSITDDVGIAVGVTLNESVDLTDAASLLLRLHTLEQLVLDDGHLSKLWLTASVGETLSIADALRFGIVAALSENVTLTDTNSATTQRLLIIAEALGLAERNGANVELTAGLSELLALNPREGFGITAATTEAIDLAETLQALTTRAAATAERLGLTPRMSAAVSLYAALVETLTLRDLSDVLSALSTAETVALADQLDRALLARVATAETVDLAEQMQFGLTLISTESMALDDAPSLSLTALLGTSETVAFIARLPLDGVDYEAWVLNADTSGMTQYTNFPMNSLVPYQNRTYGLTETGLYLLEGEDDAGTAIDAHARLGFMDFGTPHLKRMPRAYLHVKSDNALYLKVISERDGDRKEIWYSLGTREFDGLATRRVKLGRGIAARHYALEVANVDGGTLDLRDIKVLPVTLQRR